VPNERPFKKFFCDRRDTLKMPHVAFKIWMYHYVCEQDEGPTPRESWPSVPTIMETCGIKKRDTVFEWRSWLVDNGWLQRRGEKSVNKKYSIPIFRVTRGTVPTSPAERDTSPQMAPTSPAKRDSDQSRQTGQEVEPSLSRTIISRPVPFKGTGRSKEEMFQEAQRISKVH
jgi:hypothetical protein